MLLHRVMTAIVLIAAALLVLFVFPPFVYVLVSGVVLLYGAWEWTRLMQLRSLFAKGFYLALIFVLALFFEYERPLGFFLMLVALLWWVLQFSLILAYPRATKLWANVFVRGVTGVLVMVPTWLAVNHLYFKSPWWMLILFLIIWGSDTAAYFSGRFFGKRKLLPAVSPGKTWAGFWGAFATSVLLALICLFATNQFGHDRWFVFGLFIVTMLFSVLGDLVESMYKREAGIKDSGHLFPGHGGLLDRIDSLTAAAPLFFIGLMFYQVL